MLEGPLRNKPFLHLTIAFIFAILAQAIFLGVLVYYLRYNLNLNDTQVSLVNIIMWIVALFWVFPIDHWSTKYSKVVSWTISMGIWLLCMIVFPLFFLKPGFNRSADHYDEHSRSWVKRTVSGYLCHDF